MSVLRSDAQRNLERVLSAAAEAFAAYGPDVSIDEIARRAGVGHATVFRRFPTKGSLIDAVMEEHVRRVRRLADDALGADDAGAAFTEFVWGAAELHMEKRGLHACLPHCETAEAADLEHAALELVERAQRAGAIRRDVTPLEVGLLVRAALETAPTETWRAFLRVVLDGLQPPDPRS